jgi:hypothetical protein
MKFVTRWLPKLKPGKSPGKDDIVERKEPPPLNRLAVVVYIGALILIGTGAILAVLDALPKKGVTHELDAAEVKAPTMQQDALPIESKPTNPDLLGRITSNENSSQPAQDLVIRDLPGSYYRPPLARKLGRRRFGTEPCESEWHFRRQLYAVAQKPGYARLQESVSELVAIHIT